MIMNSKCKLSITPSLCKKKITEQTSPHASLRVIYLGNFQISLEIPKKSNNKSEMLRHRMEVV